MWEPERYVGAANYSDGHIDGARPVEIVLGPRQEIVENGALRAAWPTPTSAASQGRRDGCA